MYTVLVVDDEPGIAEFLKLYFEMYKYNVIVSENGQQALKSFRENKVDIVITDIMMPEMDGYELAQSIREISDVPILFLSAKTEVADRIKGLRTGADDYIVKPFDPLEVVTRVEVNLRRCYGYSDERHNDILKCGNLEFDVSGCKLYKNKELVELTALEYRILQFFMENQGKVLTKNQIYETAWLENQFPDDNSIMVAISKIRTKINDERYRYIHTIRGLGYRMEAIEDA